jgi:hypothetical protein
VADGEFDWELIDHRLVGLKLTELSEEMHDSIRAEIGQIQVANVGNHNSQAVNIQITAMQLRRADEWIEKTYKAYCDVWEKQGHPKAAAFIRAVASHVIPAVISARTNGVVEELSLQRLRTNSSIELHKSRVKNFRRSMNRLATRWTRRLEIEAREREHAESATGRQQQPAFDQRENLARAIAGRKVEIERISRVLDNLPAPGTLGRYGTPIRVSQNRVRNLIRRRQEHEAALAEMERERDRLLALERKTVQGGSDNAERSDQPSTSLQQTAIYRTPYEGLKDKMKVADLSSLMQAANLTNKQYDSYSLVKEYQRPMNEVELRMGITRKTIHEHIAAAERAMKMVSLMEYRRKVAAKRRDND